MQRPNEKLEVGNVGQVGIGAAVGVVSSTPGSAPSPGGSAIEWSSGGAIIEWASAGAEIDWS